MSTVLIGFLLILAFPTFLWLFLYFGPILLLQFFPVQNLRKKYKAEWALVTGGSSGIGRAFVDSLAEQGFNIVIVALESPLLDETCSFLGSKYNAQQFVKVAANFSPGSDYMSVIRDATKEKKIQCIFNNAGYIVTGFYDSTDEYKQESNLECNAVAAAKITKYFLSKMIAENLKGCVVFTSSTVAYMPCPFSVMYGATKSFITSLAGNIAIEVRCKGIDVLSFHPSPVATNFYSNLDHKISLMEKAKQGAVEASSLPNKVFKALGYMVWLDLGAPAIFMRLASSLVPGNFLVLISAIAAPFLPDYKNHDVNRGTMKAK